VFEHVRDAITMLGLDRVRAVATLMILSSLSTKPPELARIALIRARYCQLLGSMRSGDPQKHFVAGLFSVLDAFLDESMGNVIAKLPLDAELTAALLERRGELGEALGATIACERAEWNRALLNGVDVDELGGAYVAALAWADNMQAAVETS
jgi:EAL and modified HD-GYP domain-containing signal transduction protein